MLVICLKIKGMNKEDIEELKEIVQAAKRLEELIKEIEDVVSRIDSALHHPEECIDSTI